MTKQSTLRLKTAVRQEINKGGTVEAKAEKENPEKIKEEELGHSLKAPKEKKTDAETGVKIENQGGEVEAGHEAEEEIIQEKKNVMVQAM